MHVCTEPVADVSTHGNGSVTNQSKAPPKGTDSSRQNSGQLLRTGTNALWREEHTLCTLVCQRVCVCVC